MARFNQMFASANCAKRVHYDVLELLADTAPDPAVDTLPFAVFLPVLRFSTKPPTATATPGGITTRGRH